MHAPASRMVPSEMGVVSGEMLLRLLVTRSSFTWLSELCFLLFLCYGVAPAATAVE